MIYKGKKILGEGHVPEDYENISIKHNLLPSQREREKALHKPTIDREQTVETQEKTAVCGEMPDLDKEK